jgi:hypothetical protein
VIDVFGRCEWTPYGLASVRLRREEYIGGVDWADLALGICILSRPGTFELSLRSHLIVGIRIIPIDRDGRHEAGEDVKAILMIAT